MKTQKGYTMVAVVIGIAILSIAVAAVAPAVSTVMRRERELELIFRGRQYARAIVLFQRRYGRLPVTLEELYKARPRTIRKLWKDPMCDCLDWYPLIQGTVEASTGQGGPGGGPAPPGGGDRTYTGLRPTPAPTPGFGAPIGMGGPVGPIIGVRSKVRKEALKQWRGRRYYDEWRFIAGDADSELGGVNDPSLLNPNWRTRTPGAWPTRGR
ncbi:MAG TPA: type II secretion system protein [Thermoanaerobaculia bacterium]